MHFSLKAITCSHKTTYTLIRLQKSLNLRLITSFTRNSVTEVNVFYGLSISMLFESKEKSYNVRTISSCFILFYEKYVKGT